jgi:acyl-CoA synthetase (AMP-forming)/AMP-acid ligase II
MHSAHNQGTEIPDPVGLQWLGDIVRRNLDANARGGVFTHGDREWDWTEFDARVRRAATGIRSDLLKRGEKIAVLHRNHPMHFELLFAASNMGLVCTFIDWRLSPEEVLVALNDAEARLLFIGEEFLDLHDSISPELDTVISTITVGGPEDEYEEWLETHETHEALLRAAREVAASSSNGEVPVLRVYSSKGRQGPSKGEYTHRRLLAEAAELQRVKRLGRDDSDVVAETLTRREATVRVLAAMSAGAVTTLVREI